jgi:ABC-type dipeptide/oligopeptide/nickel transport system ATPase component
MRDNVLTVHRLRTEFRISGAWHAAVDDVSFALAPRETLALVGESGCGKSVTALSVMGLVPTPQGRIAGGSIVLEGRDLVGLRESALEKLRGARMAMTFQEPMTSLNPVMTIGAQVAEALMVHQGLSRRQAGRRRWRCWMGRSSAARCFTNTRISFPAARASGDIAMVPPAAVLLADEPTTALDVTIRRRCWGLLADLK